MTTPHTPAPSPDPLGKTAPVQTGDGKPVRVQLRRTKGWRMPPNTVKVDRSTKWGNPYQVLPTQIRNQFGVVRDGKVIATPMRLDDATMSAIAAFRREVVPFRQVSQLRGKNLACWCKLDEPCHADVLLELANQS